MVFWAVGCAGTGTVWEIRTCGGSVQLPILAGGAKLSVVVVSHEVCTCGNVLNLVCG